MSDVHPMRRVRVEKVVVNIGVGSAGEALESAKVLLNRLTGKKVVETCAKKRNPTFKLRPGLPIGAKVTLRGRDAEEFIKRVLTAKKHRIPASSFDNQGNVSLGVHEYIDVPGIKYDPNIGLFGFDVCITLSRPGKRVKLRRKQRAKIGKRHLMTKEDGMQFMKEYFNVEIVEG
jgi:large subunit ribosomal protein L5